MSYAWTDDPVVADTTKIRKVHIEELRVAVSAEITRRSGTPDSFTDPVLQDGTEANPTKCREVHITELRESCREASVLPCLTNTIAPPSSWSDDPIEFDITKIRATHIEELRDYTDQLSGACLCNCDSHCSCNCNDCGCNHCGSHCSPH